MCGVRTVQQKTHRTAELRNGITLHSFTSSGSADSYRPERQAGSCAKMTIGFLAPNPIPHNALVCYLLCWLVHHIQWRLLFSFPIPPPPPDGLQFSHERCWQSHVRVSAAALFIIPSAAAGTVCREQRPAFVHGRHSFSSFTPGAKCVD